MNEAEREKIFWWISMALLVSTPFMITAVIGEYSGVSGKEDWDFIWDRNLKYLIPFGVGSIIVNLIFNLIISPQRKVWIKNPGVTVEHNIRGDVKKWRDRHFALLKEAGFFIDVERDDRHWHIGKNRSGPSYGFAENAFSGDVSVTKDNFGARAQINLVYNDTVIVETGELSRLRQLALRLMGDGEIEVEKEIHLTLGTAVILALTAHVLFYAEKMVHVHMPGFGAAFLAAGEAAWMLVIILNKPKQMIGLRVAIATIITGAAPFIGLLPGRYFPGL